MTIKNKLLGSGLALSLMIFALLITSIFTFSTLNSGFMKIIETSEIGVSNSKKTKTELSQASENLLIVSKEMKSIGDEINQTNMQVKLLERKIKNISVELGQFTQLAEQMTTSIPESDLLYDLQDMVDNLGDIEEIMRREALIGLSKTTENMLVFTSNISSEVKKINNLSSDLQKIYELSSKVVLANQEINNVSGEFNKEIKVSKNLIITLLLIVVFFTITFSIILGISISKRMNKAVAALDDIAQGGGDLTQRLDTKGNDEISQLAKAFNMFSSKIQDVIVHVNNSSMIINQAVDKVTQVNNLTSETVKKQDSESSRVAASVLKISSSIKEVASSASNAADAAEQAQKEATLGHNVVGKNRSSINDLANEVAETSQTIQALEEKSHEIGSILDTIRGVAEQTNLLALNAAIEAARAGENGRGFAVVADEVRNLAHKTQESTIEIQEVISALQDMTKRSVEAMKNGKKGAEISVNHAISVGDSLDAISNTINSISNLNNSIAKSTDTQLSSTLEIESNIQNMSAMSSTSIEGVSHTEKALGELATQIEQLQQIVGQFKVCDS
ncbi:MAG: HAMP domain-containing protein [Gammaproteobacteria bacterium]|nr:HAMP domain-containing protein [Gammaproteobacteria bacterium]